MLFTDVFLLWTSVWIEILTLFYRDCLGEAHEPSSCDNWTKWFQRIGEIRPEESMNSVLSFQKLVTINKYNICKYMHIRLFTCK